jgi:hypothetical protein
MCWDHCWGRLISSLCNQKARKTSNHRTKRSQSLLPSILMFLYFLSVRLRYSAIAVIMMHNKPWICIFYSKIFSQAESSLKAGFSSLCASIFSLSQNSTQGLLSPWQFTGVQESSPSPEGTVASGPLFILIPLVKQASREVHSTLVAFIVWPLWPKLS